MSKRKWGKRALALVATAGCLAGVTVIGTANADAGVGNPGAVTIDLDGTLAIDGAALDVVLPGLVGSASGTVSGAGALSLTSVNFPPVAFNLGVEGTATLVPALPWTGNIDPNTGAASISGTMNVNLDVLGSQCTMGPLSLALTTGTSGPATGTAYNATDGTATVVAGDTAIPAVPEGGTCAIAALINGALPLPLAAGATVVTFDAQFTPILTGGPSLPAVSVSDVTIAEPDKKPGVMNFVVSIPAPAAATVKVTLATVDGTASSVDKADFTAVKPKTVSIPKGKTSATVAVKVTGDSVSEPTENFTVVLSNPVGASIADGTGLGTITDDDPIHMTIVDQGFVEGNANNNILVTVQIDRPSDNTVKAKLTTTNATATEPTDYKKKSGVGVTFKPGSTTATVKITVVGDTVVEPSESFLVNLTDLSGAVLEIPGDGDAVITIQNDD